MGVVVEVEMVLIEVRKHATVDSFADEVIGDLADVCIAACADTVFEVGVSNVGIIMVGVAVIALEFVVPISCTAGPLASIVVSVLVDAFGGMLAAVTIFVVTGVSFCALVKVKVNVLTVEIRMSAPLEKLLRL